MKKKMNFCLVVFMLLFFASCSCGDSPVKVAEKYLECLAKGEFEEAKKYASTETASLLDLMSASMSYLESEALKANVRLEFKNVKCDVDGDSAVYSCDLLVYSSEDGVEQISEARNTVDLIKVDGQWLVKQDKEGIDDGLDYEYNYNYNYEDEDEDLD